jgi:ubiquinone/menaquinone biosynthesis C-methylase UbiE
MTRVRTQRWQRAWDKHAGRYDKEMGFWDRHLFKDSRSWVCSQASGDVLEVAIGTGLNLGYYPTGISLTGIDFSSAMLAIAQQRADDLDIKVDLKQADATSLGMPDATFDTVVCTFGLCAIADHGTALHEMMRVLKPSGRLLLADHVVATSPIVRGVQRILELATVPLQGEHFRRRPATMIESTPLQLERRERFGPFGIAERLVAAKPKAP